MTTQSSPRESARGGRRTFVGVGAIVAALSIVVPAWGAAPPANDNFAAAKAIWGPHGSVTGHNFGATKEPLEPDHAGNPGGHSVWYRWIAPADGQYAFDTFDSDFDTLLAVYTGGGIDGLAEVASSEDAGAGERVSLLSFRATAGVVYHIAIDGFAGKVGRLGLMWMPAPANDNFADAQELAGRAGSVEGTTVGATWEAGEPWGGETSGATVWYRWTAPGGTFSFDTAGSRFDTVLAVYVGASVTDLERVVANDDDPFLGCCSSRVGFRAKANETYYIAVDAYDGWGALRLSWRSLVLGTARSDRLVGSAESEEIRGLGGNDRIRPGRGDDIVFAGDGDDSVGSSGGNDRLVGGGGSDSLVDLSGRDALHGSAGDDRLNARDGARGDAVVGGGGTDTCFADSRDVRATCP